MRRVVKGLGTVMLAAAMSAPAVAQVPPAARQIEWAVAAAPERMRADATVLGYASDGKPATLRKGTGLLVCLADNPSQPNHHVSCYHRDLEPFMRRGRELRSQGLEEAAMDSVRLAEIEAGTLKMPKAATALYQIFAKPGSANVATGEVKDPSAFHVVYTPYATAESSGLPLTPIKGPWLMDPGKPWAHVMITP